MNATCFRVQTPEPGVAVVTFDRPPVNAQNRTSREELIHLLDALSEDDSVRAIVLTGAGRVFSAGADIKERVGMSTAHGEYRRHNRVTREFFYSVTDCAKPVICALNGPAIGAGYALAAGCDIIIAAEDAWVQMPEIDRGLMGGAKFLEQHLPRSVSRLLFFTGRRFPAAELFRHGMVADVVPGDVLMAEALTVAREIAAKDPHAVQTAKETFNAAALMPLREGYQYEQSVTHRLAGSAYAQEAQRAFVEKRTPNRGS